MRKYTVEFEHTYYHLQVQSIHHLGTGHCCSFTYKPKGDFFPVQIGLQGCKCTATTKKVFWGSGSEILVICGQWQVVLPSPELVPRVGEIFPPNWFAHLFTAHFQG